MAKEDKLTKLLEELVKEVRLVRETLEKMETNQPKLPTNPPPPPYPYPIPQKQSDWYEPPPNYVGDWVYTRKS